MSVMTDCNAIRTSTYEVAKYLASLLKLFLGKTDFHVKNSATLAQSLDEVQISSEDLLFSLDVVFLFTRVPLEPTLALLEPVSYHSRYSIPLCAEMYLFSV